MQTPLSTMQIARIVLRVLERIRREKWQKDATTTQEMSNLIIELFSLTFWKQQMQGMKGRGISPL